MSFAIPLCAGFLLDFLFGDPAWLPHPVSLIGRFVSSGEKVLRRLSCATAASRFACGLALSLATVFLAFALPFAVLFLLGLVSPWLRIAAETLMCYQIFAARSLATHSTAVRSGLEAGDLDSARRKLSMIVGRDTAGLGEAGVLRATVETVAENTCDGVVAPMIFMLIGGAPAGFLYKAVNTLDSMIGYKDERYIDFGKFAARLDDVLNFLPARVTALAMIGASPILGLDWRGAARIFGRDRWKHESPNSACSEAACAGALGIRLGGPSSYGGVVLGKPLLGDDTRPIEREDIPRANRLMFASSLALLVLGVGLEIAVLGWKP